MHKLEKTIKQIRPLDMESMGKARRRQDALTKPLGSLGVLEEISIKVAGITGNPMPEIKNKAIVTMAGDHGVLDEGVSAYPREVTQQMVQNFVNGGAGINVLARHINARVVVVDMGVASDIESPKVVNRKIGYGTKNMAKGPAMTRGEAVESIEAGIEVFEGELKKGLDILGVGEMGIGNTTSASAITAAITGEPVERVTGRGTGIDDKLFRNKITVIKKALTLNKPAQDDPLDVLAKVGGFEIGGMTGIYIACAANRIPAIIDGFISGAAALLACKIAPKAGDYMIASHCSVEAGHKIILDRIGIKPLLNLDLRLGEGTGAALGINLVEAACRTLSEMATFESAGVSEKNEGRHG
jgi:nicotinate-nucleotide--dimethylbenzimidazole phosphoribosyltransferase